MELFPLVIVLNIVGAAVLFSRYNPDFSSSFKNQIQSLIDSFIPPPASAPTCGLVNRDAFVMISSRVLLPGRGLHPAAIHVSKGKIIQIETNVSALNLPERSEVLNFKDAIIMPGVIDVHTHLNEPGREEWEGISTGTAAASLGGITTVVDMPLNSFPVTTTRARLEEKQKLVKAKALVNVAHWAGLTPENAANHEVLASLIEGGALGFKSFMSPSGIDDFQNVGEADIAAALPFLKKAGVPFYVHAELVSDVTASEGPSSAYQTYLATRPPTFEKDAIQLLIRLLDQDPTPASPGFLIHIAHLSDSECLPLIKAAQQRGHLLSVETCAHYLSFSAESIADGKTLFKCAPPIRGEANREALISAVVDGSIGIVSSDHSPAPPSLKQTETGDFIKAWGGISGLQYLLPATWTAVRAAGGDVELLSRVLSSGPAALAGLQSRKGAIAAGFDADLVVWEPEEAADTSVARNMHRHKLSPYTDSMLLGRTVATVVAGHVMVLHGEAQRKPCGLDALRK